MPGRPPKPVKLLKMEGKSHRTKAELEVRERAEGQLLTGVALKSWPEVNADPIAKKEFNRVKGLLKKIEKDDALHEAVINRYCLLISETKQLGLDMKNLRSVLGDLEPPDMAEAYKTLSSMDRQLMDKRKMLLQIERENIMTILAALRSIPKQPEDKKESPMAEYLKKKQAGR